MGLHSNLGSGLADGQMAAARQAQSQSHLSGLQQAAGYGNSFADLARNMPQAKPVMEDIEVWYERLRTRVVALLKDGDTMTESEYASWLREAARYREAA